VKALRFASRMEGNEEIAEEKGVKMLRRELGIWQRTEHVNIVPFLGIAYGFGMLGAMSLVSLWMPNGSLHGFLKDHDNTLLVNHRLQFLLDIANGLLYLHSLSIVHGDLNCNNVLIDGDYTARLVDFGSASLTGNIPEALKYLERSDTRPAALRWAAPEHLNLETEYNHTKKSDIYSFGCVALQVLSGQVPWSETRADVGVAVRLVQGHRPGRPTSRPIDDSHWKLIQRCWSRVQARPAVQTMIHTIQQFLDKCPQSPSLRDLLVSSPSDADTDTLMNELFKLSSVSRSELLTDNRNDGKNEDRIAPLLNILSSESPRTSSRRKAEFSNDTEASGKRRGL